MPNSGTADMPTSDMQVLTTYFVLKCLCTVGINHNNREGVLMSERIFRRCVPGVLAPTAVRNLTTVLKQPRTWR